MIRGITICAISITLFTIHTTITNVNMNIDKNMSASLDHAENSGDDNDLNNELKQEFRINLKQSVQENNYYCVPACVQMVLQHHNLSISQSQLALEMNSSPVTGTEYVDLARVVNKYVFGKEYPGAKEAGYRVQTLKRYEDNNNVISLFEERVKSDIHTGDPVFVAIDLNEIYPNLNSANHMILITGYSVYEGTNRIKNFYIVDPFYKVQDATKGGLKSIARDVFINVMIANEEPAYIW